MEPNFPTQPRTAPRRRSPLIWLTILLIAGLGCGIALRWLTSPGPDLHVATQTAVLAIDTQPSDATVMIDGVIAGQSPVADYALTVGSHSLRIEKEGFKTSTQPLRLTEGAQTLKVDLAPIEYAQLEVNTVPLGAEVYVDGDFRGASPLTVERLKPGIHDLMVQKANFATHQSSYLLHPGEVKKIANIALDNKLLAMLHANLEINPRSIGNTLDLAHFFYVNNDMQQSVRYYNRARELAALPMPPPLPDTPQEDIAFQQQLFQDEIRRVKTEEDHHLVSFNEYYGKGLDFTTFAKLYNQGAEGFKEWSKGIHLIAWVAEQAQKADAAHDFERAIELYSDHAQLHPKSGPAYAGLTACYLHAGQNADAAQAFGLAKEALSKPEIAPEDKPFEAQAWLWLGSAWQEVGKNASGKSLREALQNAGECLQKAVDTSAADKFMLADSLWHQARLVRDQGDLKRSAALLDTAYATIKLLADNSKGNPPSYERCLPLQHAIQYRLAYVKLEENKHDEAVVLFRDLVANADPKSEIHAAAKQAVEALDSGKIPANPIANE